MTFNIEWWDIDKVIPYAKNARKIRQSAIDKVAASIAEFGWRQPIVVDAKGVIAVGHVRWGAANKLKLEKVPVHVASDLTDDQIKAYRLMDNRSNEETDWDFDLLGPELADLARVLRVRDDLVDIPPFNIECHSTIAFPSLNL